MLTGSALRIASRGARGHARSALGHSRSVYTLPHDFQLFYCSAEDGKITKSLPDGRERAPLTVLLGWVGAREKTMLKYCALHHARGLDCVFLLPVWRDVLWPTERASKDPSPGPRNSSAPPDHRRATLGSLVR